MSLSRSTTVGFAVVVTLTAALGWHSAGQPAGAALPDSGPEFSDPTAIDNPLFPVVPGAVQVFSGREGRRAITVVETHLPTTRSFEWNGDSVECRIIAEHKFERGRLTQRELAYYAQADDGAVYFFGETEEEEEDDGHESGGWVVGERSVTDPEDTISADSPTLFMPARPEVGDRWYPENSPPEFVDTFEVISTGERVRLKVGRLPAIRVLETSPADGEVEHNWFADGVGLAKRTGAGFKLKLVASTLLDSRGE